MSKSINMSIWQNRPKSVLVKEIMSTFNISLDEIAKVIGTSIQYVNTKLSRNSFSVEDLLLLLYFADLKINIVSSSGDVWKTVSLKEWYPEDAHTIDEIKRALEKEERKSQYKKYLQLKNELNNMKELYGF